MESPPQLAAASTPETSRARAQSTPATVGRPGAGAIMATVRKNLVRAPVLAACLAVIGIVVVHGATAASIVAIWARSETFAHGFLVVPLCLWLVWRRADFLARIHAAPWWPGLLGVLAAGGLWFLMSLADVLGLKQFALAFMVEAAIVTVIGLRAARALLFPLVFLLFAIPVGEIFVPKLIDWTADFTVWALRISGVPVYREANHFVIPSGMWSVVEACSGIRYIIASAMVGTIYAAVAYRSPRRRAWFVAASIVTPIVANWLRAYMIVMLGHLSDNQIAVGVDHLIYGWLFFGLVMLLLFWIGSFWQEDSMPPPARLSDDAADGDDGLGRPVTRAGLFAAAIACIVAAGLWVPLDTYMTRSLPQASPPVVTLTGDQGWSPSATPITTWKPHYRGFAWDLQQSFRNNGRDAGIYIAYYRNQAKGRELVTSGNQLSTMEDFLWKQMSRAPQTVDWAGTAVNAERTQLVGTAQGLEVIRLFWVNGRITASEYAAKALTAWSKLKGTGDDSALIVLYAPTLAADRDNAAALRDFAVAMSPSIERELDRVRAGAR